MDRRLGRGCGVVNAAWRSLADECARWRDAGRPVEFWWRDDDASRPVPPLERLLTMADANRVPVALAVVPAAVDSALLAGLSTRVDVLQHGVDHRNRAAAGEKKTEFSTAEPLEMALMRLKRARIRLDRLAGERSIGVLVPPWNRLSGQLIAHLAAAGFRGLSRYGVRDAAQAAPGLRQSNTHVDLIDWHGGRRFAGEEVALGLAVDHLARRRLNQADAGEPTGWLTHHAQHDEAAWRFLEQLFEASRRLPGVRWVAACEMFTDRAVA